MEDYRAIAAAAGPPVPVHEADSRFVALEESDSENDRA